MKPETLQKRAAEYHKKFDEVLGDKYERLTDFKGGHEMLSAKHLECGEVRTAPAKEFFRRGCPICDRLAARRRRAERSAAENIRQIESRYNVKAISEYTGMRGIMLWKCNACGAILAKTVENILWRKEQNAGGLTCDCKIKGPNLVVSTGALQIIDYLRQHNIPYMREVRFDSCRYEKPLPFDFVLYGPDGKPWGAIEYNGEQHYRAIEAFGGEEELERRSTRDRVKKEWCKANGLYLLTIPYDADIIETLNRYFEER